MEGVRIELAGGKVAQGDSQIALSGVRALILDLDGVLTDTASTHRRAWKQVFDEFLRALDGDGFEPFTKDDYRRYIDGKPRYEGAASFLAARNIELPRGTPEDPPDRETVCGLANRKNQIFQQLLTSDGVKVLQPSVRWARMVHNEGVSLAVVTSSRNGRHVLKVAGLEDLFDARVDGVDGQTLGLPGKPDPAYFLEAANRLGVAPQDAAIVEDSEAGVRAGKDGAFGFVIGVADEEHAPRLREAGADVVVRDLSNLSAPGVPQRRQRIRDLPLLVEHSSALDEAVADSDPVLFLDYDGTLAPIVADPAEARLPEQTREALLQARDACILAIVSGRDLRDLHRFVDIDGIYYAASHGLHIQHPDGSVHEAGEEWLSVLDGAEQELQELLGRIDGARVERKRFAIAVHYRESPEPQVDKIREIARGVAEHSRALRVSGGKKIVELRPDLNWNKGSAVRWILERVDTSSLPLLPIYIGDDVTDEDAFAVLPPAGLPIIVRGEDDDRLTLARYALSGPDQVRQLVRRIATILAQRQHTQ